jgi:hypothetical protein
MAPKSVDDTVRRVRGEYLEMPGLRLTDAQAQRLWGLDAETWTYVQRSLVDAKFLHKYADGTCGRPLKGTTLWPPRIAKSEPRPVPLLPRASNDH